MKRKFPGSSYSDKVIKKGNIKYKQHNIHFECIQDKKTKKKMWGFYIAYKRKRINSGVFSTKTLMLDHCKKFIKKRKTKLN